MKTYNVVFRQTESDVITSKEIQFSYMCESSGLVKFLDDDDNVTFALPIYLFIHVEIKQ